MVMNIVKTGKRSILAAIILLAVIISVGGCGEENPVKNPTEVLTEDGNVIRYYDPRETTEETLGMESTARSIDNFRKYTDGTQIIYRDIEGSWCTVYIDVCDSSYTTYKGIRVGDSWEDVKKKLDSKFIVEHESGSLWMYKTAYDGDQQIDMDMDYDNWEEDWIGLQYVVDEGVITDIVMHDKYSAFWQ